MQGKFVKKILALVAAAHLAFALPAMPMDIEETIIPIVQPPALEVQPTGDEEKKERNRKFLKGVLTVVIAAVALFVVIRKKERCDELKQEGMLNEFHSSNCDGSEG